MIRVIALLALILGLGAATSYAKEVPYFPSGEKESADGTFFSKEMDGGRLVYELVPATDAVAATIATAKCDALMIDGTVLSRTREPDYESHGPDREIVKILVRKTGFCARSAN
jgi:hypothetical protein